MRKKILRRCSICKRFHASYLMHDPKYGKRYLCSACWKGMQGYAAARSSEAGKNPPPADKADVQSEDNLFD